MRAARGAGSGALCRVAQCAQRGRATAREWRAARVRGISAAVAVDPGARAGRGARAPPGARGAGRGDAAPRTRTPPDKSLVCTGVLRRVISVFRPSVRLIRVQRLSVPEEPPAHAAHVFRCVVGRLHRG